ncbi:hypothetical protein J2Z23_002767 [Lederbergia galactosidilyticus]|uniref:hypothetical protein n=1 Tax=Lederbergia galactosidilytica TaxID=217031 RepID=UPI0013F4E736|nr:hypothetical protein [Lederbergia galactosidilytica]MBP1915785.1 hypothetical protein [Lederbergia galactosidilytica]
MAKTALVLLKYNNEKIQKIKRKTKSGINVPMMNSFPSVGEMKSYPKREIMSMAILKVP